MRLVSSNCMECGTEMAKVGVPEVLSATGERKPSPSILCVPCAEKARQIKLETMSKKVAVFFQGELAAFFIKIYHYESIKCYNIRQLKI